jgi:hypothetical protein
MRKRPSRCVSTTRNCLWRRSQESGRARVGISWSKSIVARMRAALRQSCVAGMVGPGRERLTGLVEVDETEIACRSLVVGQLTWLRDQARFRMRARSPEWRAEDTALPNPPPAPAGWAISRSGSRRLGSAAPKTPGTPVETPAEPNAPDRAAHRTPSQIPVPYRPRRSSGTQAHTGCYA